MLRPCGVPGTSSPAHDVMVAEAPRKSASAVVTSTFCRPSVRVSTCVSALAPGVMPSTTAACVPLMLTMAETGAVSWLPPTLTVGALKLTLAVRAMGEV